MRERIRFMGAILLLIILVPYMVTLFFHGETAGFLKERDQTAKTEEKVLLLLSEQISGGEQPEAIKAQAVIARTTLYVQPDLMPEGNARNLKENAERLQYCVEATKGEVLLCRGEPVDAAYHKVSATVTRNGADVKGQQDKTYLKSVDSAGDLTSPDYLAITFMEKEEVARRIEELLNEDRTGDLIQVKGETILKDLCIKERDGAQYVTIIRYKDQTISGEAVRAALSLRSAAFYLSELDGKVRIMTKGLGHGLGLSQYGAALMAAEGKTYEEILKYYYTGVEIGKIYG